MRDVEPGKGDGQSDFAATVPWLTIHYVRVDPPTWRAHPDSLTVWINLDGSQEDRDEWLDEAVEHIRASGVGPASPHPAGRRLRIVDEETDHAAVRSMPQ